MSALQPEKLDSRSRLVVACALLLLVAGLFWYGLTLEGLQRAWRNLVERPGGPMALRFVLQPSMAAIAAVRDGIGDARTGRSPYFWTVVHKPRERTARLAEAVNATARIVLLGLVIDAIYQLMVLNTFYPAEAVVVAFLFGLVPYLLIRGPAARVARGWGGSPRGREPR